MHCKHWWCCGCVGAAIAALSLLWGVVKELRSAPAPPTAPANPADVRPDPKPIPTPPQPAPGDRPLAWVPPSAPGPDDAAVRQRLDDLDKLLKEERQAREEAEAREKALAEAIRKLHDEGAKKPGQKPVDPKPAPPQMPPAFTEYAVVFRQLGPVKEPKWIAKDPERAEHYGKCLAALGFPATVNGKPRVRHWPSGWSSVAYEPVPDWRRVNFPDAATADVHVAVLRDLGFECRVEHGGG